MGEECGTVHFSTHLDSATNYVLPKAARSKGSLEVPITTLDRWAEDTSLERLDILKVDVEGLEMSVFRGAVQSLSKFKPTIYFEYISNFSDRGEQGEGAFSFLRKLGYSIQAVALDGSLTPIETSSPERLSNDYLAVHETRGF